MKKRILLIIAIAVVVIIIGIITLANIFNTSDEMPRNELEQKGFEIFGYNYCRANHSLEGGGDAFTKWECKLCGYSAMNADTNTPEICNNCAIITGRCMNCGKLEEKNTNL